MHTVQQLQDLAVSELQADDQNAQIDPAVIQVIVEAVMAIIEALSNCSNASRAAQICHDPSLLQRRWVDRYVARQLGGRANRKYGNEVTKALYAAGKKVTADQMSEAFGELN